METHTNMYMYYYCYWHTLVRAFSGAAGLVGRDSESILVGCGGGRGAGDMCECVPGGRGACAPNH